MKRLIKVKRTGTATRKINHLSFVYLITINPQKQGIPSLGGIKQREPLYATGEFYVKLNSGY